MLIYLAALQNGTLWAAKMSDASGKYSSLFFFGNDYWLGSSTLCEELDLPYAFWEPLPFSLNFYVAKIRININDDLTPVGVAAFILIIIMVATVLEYRENAAYKEKHLEESANNNNNNCNNNISTIKHHIDSQKMQNEIKNEKDGKTATSSKSELGKKMLLSFSFLRNGSKIINIDPLPNDSIKCLHGLRFFSICWIILVHTYLEVFAVSANKSMRVVTERIFLYRTIANGVFSVDTFFFISGLLVTIGYLKRDAKKDVNNPTNVKCSKTDDAKRSITKFWRMLFYRYIRLTPAYLFVLGVNELVMRYYHNSSVFSPAIIDNITCKQYWWRNALYINNFFSQWEFCMLWTWYMANDMQFFIMAIILLAAAVRSEKCFKFASATIIIFLISSWITTFTIAIKYNYIARVEEPFALFDQLYDKPWVHVGPYLIGMCTGYLLLRTNFKMELPKYIIAPCWILSIACLTSLVYGMGKDGLVIPASAVYVSLGHTAWAVSVAWITIACCTGYGGIVNDILCFRGFLPFSRLAYCAYLIHPVLMCITSFQLDGPITLTNGIMVVIYFGNVVISFATAVLISVGFEAPFIQLLKLIT